VLSSWGVFDGPPPPDTEFSLSDISADSGLATPPPLVLQLAATDDPEPWAVGGLLRPCCWRLDSEEDCRPLQRKWINQNFINILWTINSPTPFSYLLHFIDLIYTFELHTGVYLSGRPLAASGRNRRGQVKFESKLPGGQVNFRYVFYTLWYLLPVILFFPFILLSNKCILNYFWLKLSCYQPIKLVKKLFPFVFPFKMAGGAESFLIFF
jgi:hypothetical protein